MIHRQCFTLTFYHKRSAHLFEVTIFCIMRKKRWVYNNNYTLWLWKITIIAIVSANTSTFFPELFSSNPHFVPHPYNHSQWLIEALYRKVSHTFAWKLWCQHGAWMPVELKCILSLRTCVNSYFPSWSPFLGPKAHKILTTTPTVIQVALSYVWHKLDCVRVDLTSFFQGLAVLHPWTSIPLTLWFNYAIPWWLHHPWIQETLSASFTW